MLKFMTLRDNETLEQRSNSELYEELPDLIAPFRTVYVQ